MRAAKPSLIGDAYFFGFQDRLQIFPVDGEPEVLQEVRADEAIDIRTSRQRVVDADVEVLDRRRERVISLANRHGGRRGGIGQLPRADYREVFALDRFIRTTLEAFDVDVLRRARSRSLLSSG